VMVGEQAQEMQLAHWIPTTPISQLENLIPAWMGMWFAVFPTTETLIAQALAAIVVIGSYYGARYMSGASLEESPREIGPQEDAKIVERLETVDEQESGPAPQRNILPGESAGPSASITSLREPAPARQV
jgi:hypothetical protein